MNLEMVPLDLVATFRARGGGRSLHLNYPTTVLLERGIYTHVRTSNTEREHNTANSNTKKISP